MIRLVLGALSAALLVASSAPAAHAAADSAHVGGCSFAQLQPRSRGGQSGVLDIEAVVYSPTSGNPVSATVTCWIEVRGVAQPGATLSASGTVAVVGAAPATYVAPVWEVLTLCQRVDYTGVADTTPTSEECFVLWDVEWPPPWWDTWHMEYALTCPLLVELNSDVGPLWIAPDGDVVVGGEKVWDCPPFGAG